MPAAVKRFADLLHGLGRRDHFPRRAIVAQILSAGVEHDAHHLVFVGLLFGNADVALAVEHPADGAVFGHVSAVLGEQVADFAHDAIAVVGHHLHQHSYATRPVALEHHFVESFAFERPGAALNGALDIVVGHVLALGREDGGAQARIGIRIGASYARGNGQFSNDLGENLARRASVAAFLCLMVAHFECPDMVKPSILFRKYFHGVTTLDSCRVSVAAASIAGNRARYSQPRGWQRANDDQEMALMEGSAEVSGTFQAS